MNKEIVEAIKKTKSANELKDIASKNGFNLSNEEANKYFDLYHSEGKVGEEELDNVTGGSTCINNKHYSDDSHGRLIVVHINICDGFISNGLSNVDMCSYCKFFDNRVGRGASYCKVRTRWDDPYNKAIGTKRIKGPNGLYWNDEGEDWGEK